MTKSFFAHYLLGESLKNILIRLTIILSAIMIIWCCLLIILIFYTKYQRKKYLQYLFKSHRHLYDSKLNLTMNHMYDIKHTFQHDSSSSIKYHSIRKVLPVLKQKYPFPSNINQTSLRQKYPPDKQVPLTINDTHAIIKAMTKPPLIFNQKTMTTTTKSNLQNNPTTNQLQNLPPTTRSHAYKQCEKVPYVINDTPIKTVKLDLRQTFSFDERHREFKIQAHCLSNVNLNLSHLPTIAMSPSRSFVRDSTLNKRRYALSNDQITHSRDHHRQHLPLVMITDTNVSYTNIVELETFEDKYRVISDVEKRLIRQLRASRRPRHST